LKTFHNCKSQRCPKKLFRISFGKTGKRLVDGLSGFSIVLTAGRMIFKIVQVFFFIFASKINPRNHFFHDNFMDMKKPVAIIGIGQMGGVFAKGFLKAGYPVYPVVSGMSIALSAESIPDCEFILVAVPEKKLHPAIQLIPDRWKNKLGLLQNELLPQDWQKEGIQKVTAMAVWFEKKKGREVRVFRPTSVYGPHADIVRQGLHELDIPCSVLSTPDDLLVELVKKNLYVLTINIAGLEKGGTTGDLLANHFDFAQSIANEVIGIQEWLTGNRFNRDELISFLAAVFKEVPEHRCRGRVAEERLERALTYALKAGIETPFLTGISDKILKP
jgi:hypothetical protein